MSDPKKVEKEVVKMEPAKAAAPAKPATKKEEPKKEVAKKEEVKAKPKAAAPGVPTLMDVGPTILRPDAVLLPANPTGNPRYNPGTCGQVIAVAAPIDWKTPAMILSP